LLRGARLLSQSTGPETSGVSSLALDGLPVPHPLDFDWRFSGEAVQRILAEATLLNRHRGSVGVVGAPSVVLKASRTWTRGGIVAFDINPRVIASLGQLGDRVISLRRDFLIDEPPRLRLDVVVTDPPWYFNELCSALWFCHAACRAGGFVLASISPLGTRPGIAEERAKLVDFTSRLDLHLVRIEAAERPYRSPPFERNALRVAGIDGAPVDWRRGDLAVFTKRGSAREARPTASRAVDGEWCDVSFSTARVRVRPTQGRGFSDPRLSPSTRSQVEGHKRTEYRRAASMVRR
jgi:hypothetical protein